MSASKKEKPKPVRKCCANCAKWETERVTPLNRAFCRFWKSYWFGHQRCSNFTPKP